MQTKFLSLDEKSYQSLIYYMPENLILQQLANFFSIFGDATRLKILTALSISQMCVNDLASTLNINQTTISHQLKLLKAVNAVKDKRDGKIIYYTLATPAIGQVLLNGVEHLENM